MNPDDTVHVDGIGSSFKAPYFYSLVAQAPAAAAGNFLIIYLTHLSPIISISLITTPFLPRLVFFTHHLSALFVPHVCTFSSPRVFPTSCTFFHVYVSHFLFPSSDFLFMFAKKNTAAFFRALR